MMTMLLSLLWTEVAIRDPLRTRREDMATEIVDEIEGVLKKIGQLEKLVEPKRFAERVDALETIELQVLDRIENVMYMEGHQPALAPLISARGAALAAIDGGQ